MGWPFCDFQLNFFINQIEMGIPFSGVQCATLGVMGRWWGTVG